MNAHTFLDVWLILLGPAMGSFLALLADRLPRGEAVGLARSACRSCGQTLGWRDLVPVVSFVLLRGRCRGCGAPIPPVTLYTEIAATGAAVLAVIVGGAPLESLVIAAILWALLGLAVTDLLWFRLPDVVSFALCVLALLWAALWGHGLAVAGIGAVLGAGSFEVLRRLYRGLRGRDGLGLGDVKLMVGLGALVGPLDLALMVLLASLSALAVAGLQALQRRAALRASRALPFGAALAGAGAALWLARM